MIIYHVRVTYKYKHAYAFVKRLQEHKRTSVCAHKITCTIRHTCMKQVLSPSRSHTKCDISNIFRRTSIRTLEYTHARQRTQVTRALSSEDARGYSRYSYTLSILSKAKMTDCGSCAGHSQLWSSMMNF